MKRDLYHRKTADAGGGTTDVPFYEFVAPTLHVGEAVATALTAVYRTVERGVTEFNRWRWERTTRRTLASLDNTTLADIGVARSEIAAVARKAAENPTFTPPRRSRWIA